MSWRQNLDVLFQGSYSLKQGLKTSVCKVKTCGPGKDAICAQVYTQNKKKRPLV